MSLSTGVTAGVAVRARAGNIAPDRSGSIRAVIADDEPAARQRLSRMLAGIEGVEVVELARTGHETLAAATAQNANLLLLDLEMPGIGGLEVISRLPRERRPAVIIVTAHPNHAVAAFDLEVVDYVLKPVSATRLARAVDRARNFLKSRDGDAAEVEIAGYEEVPPDPPAGRFAERLLVPAGDRVTLVPVNEIDWFESAGNYIRIHIGQRSATMRKSMLQLERMLDPARFQRIHRGVIVRIECVRQLRASAAGDLALYLHDGTELAVSRSYRRRFLAALHRH